MRYLSIELHNYAGIYNGMGLTQIKIDFTKCITNKIIIRGSNGSGKSTLLNAINPNPDSNDKFIPNTEARKIIHLLDGNTQYIIKYIHPVTSSGNRGNTKGYISKIINGEAIELNPNGNITSCKEILYDEFNLDSNYLSLSKLSSEDRGLVDSKPAERKKLVSSILNTLDTYNSIFKLLSKKNSAYKSLINSLTYKIDYIGNDVVLNNKLQNIVNRLSTLETEKNNTIEAIAAVKIKISEYLNILKENNYDEITNKLKETESTIKSISNSVNKQLSSLSIENDINKINSFLEYLNSKCISIETKISEQKATVPILLNQYNTEYNELVSKKEKLNGLQSEYNYIDIKNSIKEFKDKISEYDKVFAEMKLLNINLITKTEFDSAMESLMYLKDLAYTLTSSYDLKDIKYVVENQHNMTVMSNQTKIYELKNELNSIRENKSKLEKEYTIYKSKREIASELVNRPKECTIDTCPYIESAVLANIEYPKDKLDNIYDQIKSIECRITELENEITNYETYSEINTYIKNINRELNSKIIFKLPIRSDFKSTFFTRLLNMDKFDEISELYKYVDCGNMIEEYKVISDQLHKYEVEYKLYESKNNIIESILNDINTLTDKTNELNNQINDINNSILDNESKLSEIKSSKEKIKSIIDNINNILIPSENEKNELLGIKSKLDNYTVELEQYQDKLNKLNSNIGSIENDINNLSKERDSIKHSLIMLDEYKKELEVYNEKYTKIEKIRYYSSSSTGIQTLFIQLYMNKIIYTANDLLSLLFEGEFVLQPFVINENEFRIPCLGSGLLHDDISSMSTAQKCMISMIISFSILYQSATKYNIIFLDELDGGLDVSNRSHFINLLDRLMGMLRCEQAFIISHNNELTSEIADLIVLKNNSNEQYNGNIIWKY